MSKSPTNDIVRSERDAKVAILYHASPFQGLTKLEPRVATHGHAWVYATPDIVIASLFLGRLGKDLTCGIGTIDGHPFLQERFIGAFDLRYDIGGASLYLLAAEGFVSGKTSWRQDWVCEQPVVPLQEITIDDVRSHLLGLVAEGCLTLHRYDVASSSQTADTDLLPVFMKLYAHGGDKILDHVIRYYPHLVSQIYQMVDALKQ